MCIEHTEVPSPDVAALTGFAVQVKLARFMGAGASAIETLRFGFNPFNATGIVV